MISDTPGQGGRGVKKGQFFEDVLYGLPPRPNLFQAHKLQLSINDLLCRILALIDGELINLPRPNIDFLKTQAIFCCSASILSKLK